MKCRRSTCRRDPRNAEKGESFTVAAATVQEGITLKIYLISPDGVRTLVSAGDKITAERTGESA